MATTHLIQIRSENLEMIPAETSFSFEPTQATLSDVNRHWELLKSSRPKVFDGPLVHLASVQKSDGKITMSLASGLTYKQVVGLRASAQPVLDSQSPRAFGVMIAFVSSDNQLILRWREGGDWEPSFEMPGGFIRPGEDPLKESPYLRLQEDLGVTPETLEAPESLAIYSIPEIFEAVLLVRIRSKLSAEEILRRHPGLAVAHNSDAIAGLLGSESSLHSPTIHALGIYLQLISSPRRVKKGNLGVQENALHSHRFARTLGREFDGLCRYNVAVTRPRAHPHNPVDLLTRRVKCLPGLGDRGHDSREKTG